MLDIQIKDEVTGRLKRLETSIKTDLRKTLQVSLSSALTRMISRIQSRGVGSDGAGLKAYSPAYAKKKASRGRNTSTVDMTFSGDMLRNLDVSVTSNLQETVGEIKFRSSREAAKARGNLEHRPNWFGLTENEFDQIVNEIENGLDI